MWGSKTGTIPPWARFVLVFVLVGGVGVLAMLSLRYVDRKETKKHQPESKELPEPAFDVDLLVKKDPATGNFFVSMVNSGPDVEHATLVHEYFVAQREDDQIRLYRLATFREAPDANLFKRNQGKAIFFNFSDFCIRVYQFLFAKNHCSFLGVKTTMTFRRYEDEKEFRRVWVYDAVGAVSGGPPIGLRNSSIDGPYPPETRKDVITASEVMPFIDSDDHWTQAIATYDKKTGEIMEVH
jgi:hypothetical protein